jgi:hypothetical protein
MEKETIFIQETFRTTESMKKRILEFSKKIGENKSELIRSSLNFMMAYFNNQDDFEAQKEHIVRLLVRYETKRLTNLKYGENLGDVIGLTKMWSQTKTISDSDYKEKYEKLGNKIIDEVNEELKEKFADFMVKK